MADLKNFFEQVLKIEYLSGGYQESKHEESVENLLIENGFTKSKLKSISKMDRDLALVGVVLFHLADDEYIYQPTGRNDSPDFIVKYRGQLYFIECKSSQQIHPVYNGGLPKPEYIYIFSSKKTNKTTIFYGKDILSKEKRDLYRKLKKELDDVLKKYQNMPEWKNDNRGFDYYIRNMYVQNGGKYQKDYFLHQDRKKCEQNVFDSIGE